MGWVRLSSFDARSETWVLRRKASRAHIAELAVWARVVVVVAKVSDDDLRLGQRPEHFPVEALVAQAAVEALNEAVLPGTTRIDVDGLDLLFCQPALHLLGDELRTVVAA